MVLGRAGCDGKKGITVLFPVFYDFLKGVYGFIIATEIVH